MAITVKRVDDGLVSSYINDVVKIGDRFKVSGPKGDFTLGDISFENYIFFAGGSGITPIYSLLKELIYSKSDNRIILFYSINNINEAIFLNEILNLNKLFKDRLILKVYSSVANSLQYDFVSNYRLTTKEIEFCFDRYQLSAVNSIAYVCGPKSYMSMITTTLKNRGLSDDQILVEQFTAQTPDRLPESHVESLVSVRLNGENYEYVSPLGISILDAAIMEGVPMRYSCRNGSCGLCEAYLIEGDVYSISVDNANSKKKLLCRSYPTTRNISIEVK
jgi:ring-1,2-phenylacetyl-CoA epoxidase subunit PaaE